jgi:hypothetical protein
MCSTVSLTDHGQRATTNFSCSTSSRRSWSDTELRHASNIPFGLIVSMVSAAQMDAGCHGNGIGQKIAREIVSIEFTSRSVYLKEMTGL